MFLGFPIRILRLKVMLPISIGKDISCRKIRPNPNGSFGTIAVRDPAIERELTQCIEIAQYQSQLLIRDITESRVKFSALFQGKHVNKRRHPFGRLKI